MDNVSKLPELGVVLDLDAEERDPAEVKPPFVVKIGGRNVTFADPNDLDWRDLVDIEHPGDLLQVSLERADREHIAKQDIPTWKFTKLLETYYKHYDFEGKIEEARRRAAFERSPGRGL